MNKENQDKIPGWTENFLQWEKRGGKPESSQEMLWEKLQTRLQSSKRKKAIYFLRAAALLLFAASVFFLLNKNFRSSEFADTKKTPVIKTVAPGILVQAPSTLPDIPVIEKNSHSKTGSVAINKKTTIEKTMSVSPVNIESPATVVIPKEEAPDSMKQLATVPPSKPKLRIVHMNEWNAPPPPTYASLKEAWSLQQQTEPDEPGTSTHSIWPGKNKIKTSTSSGN